MSEVTVYLMGGLGNNLFQIAHAEELKVKYDKVNFNIYLQKKNWLTEILGWSIHPTDLTSELIKEESIIDEFSLVDYIYIFFVFVFVRIGFVNLNNAEKCTVFMRRTIGYWQKNNRLNKVFMNRLFSVVNDFKLEFHNLKQFNMNIIHIRRGDFDKNIQLDFSYYDIAIQTSNETNFVLVTNDRSVLNEFKENYPNMNFVLSTGGSQIEDFIIMAKASLVITSNSTFAYWATQINPVPIIYYPSNLSSTRAWEYTLLNNECISIQAFENV